MFGELPTLSTEKVEPNLNFYHECAAAEQTLNCRVRGRSLFISWGLGNFRGGGVMKKNLPQMGGGVKISFMNP